MTLRFNMLLAYILSGVLLFSISITSLNDPVSSKLRVYTEKTINNYLYNIAIKGQEDRLNLFDKSILHSGLIIGNTISRIAYPEASKLLFHYVYGDGSDLNLNSRYFRKSFYLKQKINELGNGHHGPIGLKQHEDWRLSLALNPYYINIESNNMYIYHPKIKFTSSGGKLVPTIVPIGKLKLKVYDNIISSLNPVPFKAYSQL